jgi:DNA-binding response OmpR family regulator
MRNSEILFVEDDPAILDLWIEFLRRANYQAVAAINADAGLILLEQELPLRLLITDVVLPGRFDGFALARRAKEIRSSIEIIYQTGFPTVADVRSHGAPWGRMLLKPFGRDEFIQAVASVIPVSVSSPGTPWA